METLQETLTTPISGTYDVIVVGGGPAGVGAAVAAGRMGVKVLLIEQSGNLGGVSTSGLMSHWTGETRGGIYDEIIEASKDSSDPKMRIYINPEKLKTVYLEMAQAANVDLLLYTFATKPIMNSDQITGVVVENKSGRSAYLAQYVIDCSGDGDIAAQAGVPFTKGRDQDGRMQPATLMFKVGGVDYDQAIFISTFEEDYETAEGSLQQLGRQYIPAPAGHVLLYRSTLPGVVTCNMTNAINIDGTNAQDLTQATVQCREQTSQIVAFLRAHVPGYANCYLLDSAAMIGIRETRHFKTQYLLTQADIEDARHCDDWIVEDAQFNLDIHNIDGAGLDKAGKQKYFQAEGGYAIPVGCVIPKQVTHLLIGGRGIGATHVAHSSLRAMPICANIGQGCGIFAALLVQGRTTMEMPTLTALHDEVHRYEPKNVIR